MAEWDALPPRRKHRRVDNTPSSEFVVQNDSADTTSSEDIPKLAEALLTSKDGCPSEFYECT